LPRGARCKVHFRFQNYLHSGSYGISVAVNRVSQRDYSDNILFDQVDGCATFIALNHPARPVHYKYFCPVEINVAKPED
jgi:lipopolysaccharide transport system ATP-binding protein